MLKKVGEKEFYECLNSCSSPIEVKTTCLIKPETASFFNEGNRIAAIILSADRDLSTSDYFIDVADDINVE